MNSASSAGDPGVKKWSKMFRVCALGLAGEEMQGKIQQISLRIHLLVCIVSGGLVSLRKVLEGDEKESQTKPCHLIYG